MAYQQLPSSNIIQADDDDLDALSFAPDIAPAASSSSSNPPRSANAAGKQRQQQGQGGQPALSGRIGSAPSGSSSSWNGVRLETRFTGESTLDEPVSATIMRDLRSIYTKLLQVLYPPKGGTSQALRDWDLWGPLVICLSLAITLSLDSPKDQSLQVFSLVISLVTIGSAVVTINTKLLGGKVSFFQGLCVIGYALAPLLLASIVALLLHQLYVRVPVSLACWAWSVWASVNFFNGTGLPSQRTMLAVYPLCLFFFVLAWMIMIQ